MGPRFEQLVFSGGGIRCFWHGGFLSVAGEVLNLAPERVSGVSGGVLSAAAWIAGREDRLLDVMGEAFKRNDANIDLGKDNFTPHEQMYRQVVSDTLDGDAVGAICEGPAFQAMLAVPPRWVPPRLFVLLSGAAYGAEKAFRSRPHLKWARRVGLTPIMVDAKQAARGGRLIDLICAAATIPPVFNVPEWEGQRVLDGGMVDKAPPPEPDEGRTLFLMTSRYRALPQSDRRLYIQPSAEVAADKIDFSDRTKLDRTWRQGALDGAAWVDANR